MPIPFGRQAVFHSGKNIVGHGIQIADDKILVRSRFDPFDCRQLMTGKRLQKINKEVKVIRIADRTIMPAYCGTTG